MPALLDPSAPDVAATRRPLLEAKPLAGRFFVDPEVFDLEMEVLFRRRWLCVGRETDWPEPGRLGTQEVGPESILVVRGKGNGLRAFYNVCRHRGARLVAAGDRDRCDVIRCPYHAWTYGLDGRLLAAPLMDGRDGFDRATVALEEVRLDTWHGFAFVNLRDDAPPLAEALADVPDLSRHRLGELVPCASHGYEVAANWKLLLENYSECYHCALVHPELNRISHYLSGGKQECGPSFSGGPMTLNAGFNTMSTSGRSERPSIDGLARDDESKVFYYAIYPHLLLSLHRDYVMTHTVWPLAPDRSRILCQWLFPATTAAAPGFDPSDAVDFWDLTNRQDWQVCERSQQGVASRGYRPLHYQAGEGCVHAFDTWYLDSLLAGR
jgi:Rieske 2Fe-2S family protein